MANVMVIDDDAAVRGVIRKMLERDGHTVTEVEDGKRALRYFAGEPADLVISDIFMPEMDGIEFLMRLREVFPDSPHHYDVRWGSGAHGGGLGGVHSVGCRGIFAKAHRHEAAPD